MKKTIVLIISIATLLFCLAIALDVSPYLRGPSYYAPEWRWEYLFINTLERLYVPIIISSLLLLLLYKTEKAKKLTGKQVGLFLIAGVLLFVTLQFGILYFSRSGIGVLVHRIINPEINGYFTAALTINSVPEFLRNYNSLMLEFVYHAKAHPPGAILLFYYIEQVVKLIPALGDIASQQIPSRGDVRAVWDTLQASEKATVFVSAMVISFLSALSLIPMYYAAKLLYGIKTAVRSVILLAFIPSLIFFIPINDVFLHLFSLSAFCFFVYGLHSSSFWLLIAAGAMMFLGAFFNLSLLPVLVLLFFYFLLHQWKFFKKDLWSVMKRGLYFLSGLLVPLLLLYFFFQFNFFTMTTTIMKYVPDVHTRSYTIWIFYNLYDFFVFTGLPVAITYFAVVKDTVMQIIKKHWKTVDPLVIAFTAMILILNFSGSNRGETGRIWIPFVPFIVLIVASTLTNTYKLSTNVFAFIISLMALQVLVMQEFWVMLW